MEEALRALLLGATAVTSKAGQRVDWGLRPQGQPMPAIALTVINDGAESHSLDGAGVSQALVQVDCYGATYGAAKTLARAVRVLLDGKTTAAFQGIFLNGARDLSETDSVTPIHRVSMDFTVFYHFTG